MKIQQQQVPAEQEAFFPKGAVAFFVALIAFFAFIWLGFYAIMIHRGG